MDAPPESPGAPDKPLFTPGPLTTSAGVKRAMLHDLGSRDAAFVETVAGVRRRLLALAGVSQQSGWECVLMQGSGSFGVEATLGCALPRDGKLLVLANGAYGERMGRMAEVLGIEHTLLCSPEHQPLDPDALAAALEADADICAVALVHCETTTGLVNPVDALGEVVRAHGRCLVLDSMSAFGALPLDLEAAGVDWLVSSANKCIEGVPGFSFVLVRRTQLEAAEGRARSLCLDLFAQWRGLEANGQFRFTPPTHALLAFEQALSELEEEGGPPGRLTRYRGNHAVLLEGMRALGFEEYLAPEHQGPIITSFRYPAHARFRFEELYERLNERGFVIYPGKVSDAECFRVGTIGRLFEADVRALLAAMSASLADMGLTELAAEEA